MDMFDDECFEFMFVYENFFSDDGKCPKCGADISQEDAEQGFDAGSGIIVCPHCGDEIGT